MFHSIINAKSSIEASRIYPNKKVKSRLHIRSDLVIPDNGIWVNSEKINLDVIRTSLRNSIRLRDLDQNVDGIKTFSGRAYHFGLHATGNVVLEGTVKDENGNDQVIGQDTLLQTVGMAMRKFGEDIVIGNKTFVGPISIFGRFRIKIPDQTTVYSLGPAIRDTLNHINSLSSTRNSTSQMLTYLDTQLTSNRLSLTSDEMVVSNKTFLGSVVFNDVQMSSLISAFLHYKTTELTTLLSPFLSRSGNVTIGGAYTFALTPTVASRPFILQGDPLDCLQLQCEKLVLNGEDISARLFDITAITYLQREYIANPETIYSNYLEKNKGSFDVYGYSASSVDTFRLMSLDNYTYFGITRSGTVGIFDVVQREVLINFMVEPTILYSSTSSPAGLVHNRTFSNPEKNVYIVEQMHVDDKAVDIVTFRLPLFTAEEDGVIIEVRKCHTGDLKIEPASGCSLRTYRNAIGNVTYTDKTRYGRFIYIFKDKRWIELERGNLF